jgi:hypothetical protein
MKKLSARVALLDALAAAERDFDNHNPADRLGRELILRRVRAIEQQLVALNAGSDSNED